MHEKPLISAGGVFIKPKCIHIRASMINQARPLTSSNQSCEARVFSDLVTNRRIWLEWSGKNNRIAGEGVYSKSSNWIEITIIGKKGPQISLPEPVILKTEQTKRSNKTEKRFEAARLTESIRAWHLPFTSRFRRKHTSTRDGAPEEKAPYYSHSPCAQTSTLDHTNRSLSERNPLQQDFSHEELFLPPHS